MENRQWFQKSLHRLLVDMHIPDWDDCFLKDFSAENYAEMMALARVDTAEIYSCSCLGLCYWPTDVGIRHRCLHGRDLLGETVAACRKRGINVQIYMNVWCRAVYEAHPEWRIRRYDGSGTVGVSWRYGQCCPNTGYGQYFLDMLAELNDRYDCCGFWIDMIGNYQYCFCPACQERFRKETGYAAIPDREDWNDPAWLAYVQCRSDWVGEFAEKMRRTVKATHPERTLTLQCGSMTRGRKAGAAQSFIQATDYVAGDFPGGSIELSRVCKWFSSLTVNRPMEFMTPRCETLQNHTAERPLQNLIMRAYAAAANQASFTLIDAIDPRGTLDRRFYEHARTVNSAYIPYEKYILPDSVPCMDAAVYYSLESQIDLERTPRHLSECEDIPKPSLFGMTQENLVYTLQKNHMLFGYVHGADLTELAKIPLIILSGCSSLTERECAALTEYVRNGGRLYASMYTSLYDPKRGCRKDFRLAELFGVHYQGRTTAPQTYIAPAVEGVLPGFTADYPLGLSSAQVEITAAEGTQVLGTLALPVRSPDDLNYFGSAISNPPMRFTDQPALVRHRYGKGEVIFCAGIMERDKFECQRNAFIGLLDLLLGGHLLETNAPKCVECTLFRQMSARRFVFSCLNFPDELPALPVYDLYFRLRLPEGIRIRQVLLAPEDTAQQFSQKDDILEIKMAKLTDFAMLLLEY